MFKDQIKRIDYYPSENGGRANGACVDPSYPHSAAIEKHTLCQ